jgi:Arc/MetJ family transcription regulator
MSMGRTTVNLDEDALARAQQALGTTSVGDTVNAALAEVARRHELEGFDVVRDIDGTPDEVAANRQVAQPPSAA